MKFQSTMASSRTARRLRLIYICGSLQRRAFNKTILSLVWWPSALNLCSYRRAYSTTSSGRWEKLRICSTKKLQSFVSVLYWWPKLSVDGSAEAKWDFAKHRPQLMYQREVCERGLRPLTAARTEALLDREKANVLDRLFTHRLKELAYCTFPTYRHAMVCSELVLKQAYQ